MAAKRFVTQSQQGHTLWKCSAFLSCLGLWLAQCSSVSLNAWWQEEAWSQKTYSLSAVAMWHFVMSNSENSCLKLHHQPRRPACVWLEESSGPIDTRRQASARVSCYCSSVLLAFSDGSAGSYLWWAYHWTTPEMWCGAGQPLTP